MVTATVCSVILDPFFQFLDLLLAIAGQRRELACVNRRVQFINAADAQRFPHQRDAFRTHAGELEHFEHGRLVAREQLVAQLHAAVRDHLLNVGSHALADAGNLQQLFRVVDERGQLRRGLFYGFSSAPIGPDAEGISSADLQKVGCFAQKLGYGSILHSSSDSAFCHLRTKHFEYSRRRQAAVGTRCRPRFSGCFLDADNALCLGAFLPLNNVKLDIVPLF